MIFVQFRYRVSDHKSRGGLVCDPAKKNRNAVSVTSFAQVCEALEYRICHAGDCCLVPQGCRFSVSSCKSYSLTVLYFSKIATSSLLATSYSQILARNPFVPGPRSRREKSSERYSQLVARLLLGDRD